MFRRFWYCHRMPFLSSKKSIKITLFCFSTKKQYSKNQNWMLLRSDWITEQELNCASKLIVDRHWIYYWNWCVVLCIFVYNVYNAYFFSTSLFDSIELKCQNRTIANKNTERWNAFSHTFLRLVSANVLTNNLYLFIRFTHSHSLGKLWLVFVVLNVNRVYITKLRALFIFSTFRI